MVSTDSQANPASRVIDLKQRRIEKNLKRLSELVNGSLETKQRTEDYLMALTPAERQREFKAARKQLNVWIQPEAHALLVKDAKQAGLSQAAYIESLLENSVCKPHSS